VGRVSGLGRALVRGIEHSRLGLADLRDGFQFQNAIEGTQVFEELDDACDKILAQIAKMIDQADHWAIQSQKNSSRS
jgi:hypothetical protein